MTTGSKSQPWMTPEDVRALLGLGKTDSVYQLIKSGALAASDVSTKGGRPTWRISVEALGQFLTARESKPQPAPARSRKRPKQAPVTQYF